MAPIIHQGQQRWLKFAPVVFADISAALQCIVWLVSRFQLGNIVQLYDGGLVTYIWIGLGKRRN